MDSSNEFLQLSLQKNEKDRERIEGIGKKDENKEEKKENKETKDSKEGDKEKEREKVTKK